MEGVKQMQWKAMCRWSDVWMLVDTESSVTGTHVQHGMLLICFILQNLHELHCYTICLPLIINVIMHKPNFPVVTATSDV